MEVKEFTYEQLDQLSKMVADQVTSYLEEKDKITRDKALHNTKLLLRKYKELKSHCSLVNERLEEDKDTFWNHSYLDLDSMMQNKAKTVKIMKYVDKALDHYKSDCMKAKGLNESRRYEMIKLKYIDKNRLTDDEVAAKYDIARTTVTRNLEQAFDDISILLYGIEAFVNY